MKNIDIALKAIADIHGDHDLKASESLAEMQQLQEELEIRIDALKQDIKLGAE